MKQIESEHHKAVIKYLRILKAQNKIITFFAPINETRVKSSNPIKNKAIAFKKKNLLLLLFLHLNHYFMHFTQELTQEIKA